MKTERPTNSNIILKAMSSELRNGDTYKIDYTQFNSNAVSTAAFEAGWAAVLQKWYKEVRTEYIKRISQIQK